MINRMGRGILSVLLRWSEQFWMRQKFFKIFIQNDGDVFTQQFVDLNLFVFVDDEHVGKPHTFDILA